MDVAVYPGSFDPVTNGHLDVIRRATAAFERLVVGVLANPRKRAVLSVDERIAILDAALAAELSADTASRVKIARFDGLTVEFCRQRGARFIVRGLRAISDFETEMQLAHNNRILAPEVDTVFFMTSVEHAYVSSSLVREICAFGGDVSTMIPVAALGPLRTALARVAG